LSKTLANKYTKNIGINAYNYLHLLEATRTAYLIDMYMSQEIIEMLQSNEIGKKFSYKFGDKWSNMTCIDYRFGWFVR
jgi:hypothetical protein